MAQRIGSPAHSAETLGSRLRTLAQRVEARPVAAELSESAPLSFLALEATLTALEAAVHAWQCAILSSSSSSEVPQHPVAAADIAQNAGEEPWIRIWCDGSCAPNPGPGGWAALIEQHGQQREISGAQPTSTNNIMELTAALHSLQETPVASRVRIYTDSRYLMDGITRWLPAWRRKGWRTAEGKPVRNQVLWQALAAETAKREVHWEWVRGHAGHPQNERCDVLAAQARISLARSILATQ